MAFCNAGISWPRVILTWIHYECMQQCVALCEGCLWEWVRSGPGRRVRVVPACPVRRDADRSWTPELNYICTGLLIAAASLLSQLASLMASPPNDSGQPPPPQPPTPGLSSGQCCTTQQYWVGTRHCCRQGKASHTVGSVTQHWGHQETSSHTAHTCTGTMRLEASSSCQPDWPAQNWPAYSPRPRGLKCSIRDEAFYRTDWQSGWHWTPPGWSALEDTYCKRHTGTCNTRDYNNAVTQR